MASKQHHLSCTKSVTHSNEDDRVDATVGEYKNDCDLEDVAECRYLSQHVQNDIQLVRNPTYEIASGNNCQRFEGVSLCLLDFGCK